MGIKNLHKILKKKVPQIYKELPVSAYAGKKIAVDVNVYLYRCKSKYRENWLGSFINFLLILLKHNIQCVFLYDTKAPVEKDPKKKERRAKKQNAEQKKKLIEEANIKYQDTGTMDQILIEVIKRRSQKYIYFTETIVYDQESIDEELRCLSRQAINVTSADMWNSKRLLQLMGLKYYDSDNEAETLCSYMCKAGKVDAVLSDDTDVLAYGTPKFLTYFNLQRQTFVELDMDELLNALELPFESFKDFCIMLGTDYNNNIFRIGPERALKLINKHRDIDTIRDNEKDIDVSILNHERVRDIFNVDNLDDSKIDYNLSPVGVDVGELNLFGVVHHCTTHVDEYLSLYEKMNA
jgi:5'-3' exonuclease